MKKVAIIGNSGGNMVGFRSHLIQYLLNKGVSVYCIAPNYTPAQRATLTQWGVHLVEYPLSRTGLNPWQDICSYRALTRCLKNIAPHTVLSCFAKPAIYGTLAARRAGVPQVLAMIEGLGYAFTADAQPDSLRKRLVRSIMVQLYRLALPKANRVIFLNPDDPRDLLLQNHICVPQYNILNGIGLNLKEYPYTPVNTSNGIHFLFVGRLLQHKGIRDFLKAAELVKKRYPTTLFTVVGGLDDNPTALTQQELHYYQEKGIAHFTGVVSNVVDYLKACSVFVLPSYREGLPRSTQEAMAVGRAVITTEVPGCKETVTHGVNGFLVPVASPQALADAMCKFVQEPQLITQMGDVSYQMACQRYDAHKINAQLWEWLAQ